MRFFVWVSCHQLDDFFHSSNHCTVISGPYGIFFQSFLRSDYVFAPYFSQQPGSIFYFKQLVDSIFQWWFLLPATPVFRSPMSISFRLTWGREKITGKRKRGKTPPQKKVDTWIKLEQHVRLQDKWRKSDLAWPHTLFYHSTVSTLLTIALCTSSLVIDQNS